jgi:hypothetical protein
MGKLLTLVGILGLMAMGCAAETAKEPEAVSKDVCIEVGQFTDDEMSQIVQGVDDWNKGITVTLRDSCTGIRPRMERLTDPSVAPDDLGWTIAGAVSSLAPERCDRFASDAWMGHTCLSTLAAHEVGHLFGLGHVTDPKALMFSTYVGVKTEPTEADIVEWYKHND